MGWRTCALFVLVGGLAGCPSEGGAGSSSAAAKSAAPSAAASSAKAQEKPAEDKPAEDKAEDKDDDAEGEGEGEFGVKACDDYVKQVGECKTFKKDTPAYEMIMKKWKELKDAGKTADLEKACTKAAELFKCPDK